MKNCPKCGKLMDDKFELCYKCSQEKGADPKQDSIERQVAAKCTAEVLTTASEDEIVRVFNTFIRLIRG